MQQQVSRSASKGEKLVACEISTLASCQLVSLVYMRHVGSVAQAIMHCETVEAAALSIYIYGTGGDAEAGFTIACHLAE